jgi:multicomponent Na+:H+ antiporter subunit G
VAFGPYYEMVPYLADVPVVLGVLVMTVGVYGAIRMPDTYTKLHSMSKAVFLGVVSLCASSVVTGEHWIICRSLVTAALVVFALNIHQLFIGGLAAAPPRLRARPRPVCDTYGAQSF